MHNMYSRIEHIFTHTALLPYLNIDKNPACSLVGSFQFKLSLSDLWTKPNPSPWCLNASMLNYPVLYTDIETELRIFSWENASSDTSPNINWAAHKAAIRVNSTSWLPGLNATEKAQLNKKQNCKAF